MRIWPFRYWRRTRVKRRYKIIKFLASLSDVPDQVGNDIYIVGTSGTSKWVVFDCPCGEGHKLTVNLMKSSYPRWRMKMSRDGISLSPSIVVTDHPCKSHFWLESNRAYPAFER